MFAGSKLLSTVNYLPPIHVRRAVASGPVGPVFTGPLFNIKKGRRGTFNNFYEWSLQLLSVVHQPHQPLTLFYILSVALE